MNNSKTALLVDSGCDVGKEFATEYDIRILGLKVVYGMEVFSDGVDIDPMTVYERFPGEIPTTSTPNVMEIRDLLDKIKEDGYENVIAVCISSKLSGTYNTVKSVLEEYDGLNGYALDTKNISTGSGLLAMWAAVQLKNGMSYEELVEKLPAKVPDSHVFFYMDTLDYLKAGGRIGNVTGFIGKALDLKPVITCNPEGIYNTVTMLRGRKNSVKRLVNIVEKQVGDDADKWISIMNGKAADKVPEVEAQLSEKFSKMEIVEKKQIVASLAVHTGPGLVGIGVLKL
ncbi:degV family protein [Eubacterium sp. CAG:603]|nr:degV family protein [Eubacterium sp. CAG:603]